MTGTTWSATCRRSQFQSASLLLLYPPRLDLRPTGFALLVIPQLIQTIGLEAGMGIEWFQGWFARLAFLAVFGCLVFLHWQRTGDARRGTLGLAGALIAASAAILMPSGASAALVLLALAYTIGSRPLAIIGAVGEVYFIWSFYRSLQDTLLAKSIILMAVGAVLLLCYALVLAEERREAGAMKANLKRARVSGRPCSWRLILALDQLGRSCRKRQGR